MAVSSYRVNVGPNATRLADLSSTSGGSYVTLRNSDSAFAVLIGANDVSSSNGYVLTAGSTVQVQIKQPDDVWAVTPGTTNTVVVHVFRANA